MQQAVTSSSQVTLNIPTASTLLSLNRNLLRQNFKSILIALNESIQEISVFLNTESNKNIISIKNRINKQIETLDKEAKSSNNIKIENNIRSILSDLVKEYGKTLNNSKNFENKFVVDPLIEPIFSQSAKSTTNSVINSQNNSKLASTFYENRYGFTERDLLSCEYKNPDRPRLLHLSQAYNKRFNLINLQQTRGFKTKRSIDREEGAMDLLNSLKNSTTVTKNDSFEKFNSLLSQKFGSSSKKPANAVGSDELDNRIKTAFVEGFLYRDSKDDKKKASSPANIFKFVLFVFILYMLFNSISITTGPSNGNGKSSGINIGALTGGRNFEITPEQVSVKFDDVKGLPEAKKELTEIVDFLKNPDKYTKLGARLPKGVLLVGPPGCGKTLLAKSVAGEAGVPFFQASGSDFDEMFVGTGSKRVRQLFAAARAKAPCVVFIDEIDSVGSKRTNSMIHPHANQTINQLLAEMDGFLKNEGVIVLGATNRRETLDSALLRPGRFDTEVRIDKPDYKARIEILEFYLKKVVTDKDVDVQFLSRKLAGFSGSSIENVVNQAALRAVVTGSETVKMEHMEWALDRTLMGYGKSRLDDEVANLNTAYHEAGHVLVAYFTKDSHPLHKVTMLPRSQSLGHTSFVPENDGYSRTKSQLLAQMDVSMGGRVAEELAFGIEKVTTGASADFQSATSIATQMVKVLGMSEKLGPRVFEGTKNGDDVSPQTQELIDQEIKRMLSESYERAKTILKTHSHELKQLAEALLIHETLDAEQIKNIIEKNNKI